MFNLFQFPSDKGMSDNERRYQGLLRKQRLELNYLLKERERLLEAQRKLSDLADPGSGEDDDDEQGAAAVTHEAQQKTKKKQHGKHKKYPKLTEAQLKKQQKKKGSENTMRRLFPKMEGVEFYGSEHAIYPTEQAPSDSKAPMAGKGLLSLHF